MFKQKLIVLGMILLILMGTMLYANILTEEAKGKETLFSTSEEQGILLEAKNDSLTAAEVVKEMKIGWNLGNTLDSCDYTKWGIEREDNSAIERYEQYWANPITTKEMIDEIKAAGFNAVRVPITYYDHIYEDGTIDQKWLDRIEEIVNYVLDNNMFCIINVHHDSGLCDRGSWIVCNNAEIEENKANVALLWNQIATRFKDYDYRLMFQGLNEVVNKPVNYDWVTGYRDTLAVLELNQAFVDTVRATGEKNTNRVLIVSTFGAITDDQKLQRFNLPVDIVEDRIILSLHDYATSASGINNLMNRINEHIVSRNIPVIMTEFGSTSSQGLTIEQRTERANNYIAKAKELGITCFWWDDGGSYILLNRRTLSWRFPDVLMGIMSAITNLEETVERNFEIKKINDVKYIYIQEGTRVQDIRETLNLGNRFELEAINNNGQEIINENIIGTESTLMISEAGYETPNSLEEQNVEYTVIVKGDITGDGAVNFVDIVRLIQNVYNPVENFEWTETIRRAGRVTGEEGYPGFADILRIIRYVYEGVKW